MPENLSDRGIPLVYRGPGDLPTLTIENYGKWYNIFLVKDGKVTPVGFPTREDWIETDESPVLDHAPGPKACLYMAIRLGAAWHLPSLEMIIGRWRLEYFNDYGSTLGKLEGLLLVG